ncbi:polyprenyl diphosphate synthase [Streptomyces pseudoechinosporeus]
MAAIEDPGLVAGYEACRRVMRGAGGTEYLVAQLMPPTLRPALWAIYAAGRVADDLADTGDPAARAARLDAWTSALVEDLRQGGSADLVRRALVHAARTWDLPTGELFAAFEALREDVDGRVHETWQEWSGYSQSVNTTFFAQAVALFTAAGLQMPVRLRHLSAFRQWVDALNLIDILEDLAEDTAQGRITLPLEVLQQFSVTPQALLSGRWTPGLRDMVAHLTALGREWITQPELVAGMPAVLVVAVETVSELGRLRLDRVERARGRVLKGKPRLPRLAAWSIVLPARAKASVAWRLLPPVMVPPGEPGAEGQNAPVRLPSPAGTCAPKPPRPHTSGERPPQLPPGRLPAHVAIVMDGNGRWATDRGLSRSDGHRAGADALRDVVQGALEIGLRHLTVYAFSTENWQRPAEEVSGLMTLLGDIEHDQDILSHDVRFRWAGSPEGVPRDLVQSFIRTEEKTRHRPGLAFTLCVNYGGRSELTQAAISLGQLVAAGRLDPSRICERTFAAHLPGHRMPDVDLLWRTGGEQRTSNFLLWHASYAELHFTDTLWPDIDRRDLWQAMCAYAGRERRYGAVPSTRRTAPR